WVLLHTSPFQKEPYPPVAEPAPLGRQLAHARADLRVVGDTRPAHRLGIDTDELAGSPLGDVVARHRPQGCRASLGRRRQLFPSRSFKTALSRPLQARVLALQRLELP